MTELPPGHKREARERLVHDLAGAPAAGSRRFLAGAASALVAATAGPSGASAATVGADASNLKITDLKTTILQINHQDWTTLVEVRTNQGLTGLGQTTFRAIPRVLYSILENVLKPVVIGHNPFEYERLWSDM